MHKRFFKELGHEIRRRRESLGLSQEDMIDFGFSARHWQQLESGRPMTLTTLLRISEAFGCRPEEIIDGIYKPTRKKD
jgi:transcriptional regulator with XRE-family HTH domain